VDEIESVKDEPSGALGVGRCLDAREAGQSGIVDAAELAIEIGGLHLQTRQRRGGARIFGGPVKAGPGQKLHPPFVDPRGHAISVQLNFMHPLCARGRLLDRLGKLRGTKAGRGMARREGPDLTAGEAEWLMTRGMMKLNLRGTPAL
jgi:hypothetical protein